MATANDRISPSLLPVAYWLDLSGKLLWEAAVALLPISYPTHTACQLHGMSESWNEDHSRTWRGICLPPPSADRGGQGGEHVDGGLSIGDRN